MGLSCRREPNFARKIVKLQKSSEPRGGRFLRDVSANIAISAKNDKKNHWFLVHFLDPQMAQNGINFHTLFEHLSWRLLWRTGRPLFDGCLMRNRYFQGANFARFWQILVQKGSQNGCQIEHWFCIDFALKFGVILERKSSPGRHNRQQLIFFDR